ncbi:superfamily II DNA or RNA helicase [Friedmanniella endophytica]|uniref:Superfamily II DNA or RNA helicase n=1 Tax=Microlunatus kandeliicorticis TaxID=1759536 RepID=A0A7W3P4I5_9ACTN|nr:DISARM system SNF2-like helicase DrmD [Microlunatus kandeliicorticis]MBA8792840.1 superfamily II DNA or RNA helicase [Microlunatus kandeliicorticis]
MTSPTTLEVGQLVRARGQQWIVSDIDVSTLPVDELSASAIPGRTLARLTSVSEDDLGEELTVVWEVEPGRGVVSAAELPAVPSPEHWDDPQQLGALIDAVRWGTVASADVNTLQAPFRSGIQIKDYQLEPVAKALRMPRVALLIADDVGLGKTIEAGLVVQEMLLRHRARRVIVVCPASLTLKWREEMRDKFGLDFTIVDTEMLRQLRRTHGLQANPFTIYPRMIISLPWLRTPRVQRLLDEVLDPDLHGPAFFDLMVVDEAHHCAPPAPARARRGYAVDSLQTKAVRRLSHHTQHRVLLSATPHNGHSESWQALLEIVDSRRFQRGLAPTQELVDEVCVRRLKDEIRTADGRPEFAERLPATPLEVHYTDDERRGHELLHQYSTLRTGSPRRNDLVTLLLKKRLFSSPAAFARTLAQHAQTVRGLGAAPDDDPWDTGYDYDDEPDDSVGSDREAAEFVATATALTPEAAAALDELLRWADLHTGPADRKAERLVAELKTICTPNGPWNDARVVVFTEYRDTQLWLAQLLSARGLGGNRLGLLHGGMDSKERELLKHAFQAPPDRHPVRILLATDAASEGIDLQAHCHQIINYDIPFNPNRLEQRIGRVDRFGQTLPVHVAHFVGADWQQASAGSYEADLEFLSRVASKVAQERADLGRVNPVLAQAVEARMLGRPIFDDPLAARPGPNPLRAERDLRAQVARLRTQLDTSVETLHVASANIRRLVDTALSLASQPPLVERADGLLEPPELSRGWERTLDGLADPLSPHVLRPITFDAERGNRDVVRLHLGSQLVDQAQRLVRSAVWGEVSGMSRVSGVVADLPSEVRPGERLATVINRLVLVGTDGSRLHEEVILAARAVPETGRPRRIEVEERRFDELRRVVEDALDPDRCLPVSRTDAQAFAEQWPTLSDQLVGDVAARAAVRKAALQRDLERRKEDDLRRVDAMTEQLRRLLTDALSESPAEYQPTLDELDEPQRDQLARDRAAWVARLDGLDAENERERAAVTHRYESVRELTFPVAVLLVTRPEGS